MTREDDFIGQVEGYLEEYEGMTPLPDAVRSAVRARMPSTRQVGPPWGPMKYLKISRSTPVRYGLVAAVAVVAVVLSAAILGGGPQIGGEPEVTPTPVATATAAPTAAPMTYSITNDTGATTTLTLPAGWAGNGWYVSGPGRSFIGVSAVGNVFSNPCHWTGTLPEPAVGPTVDDLATALSNQMGFTGATSSVTISGFHGTRVRQSVPADLNLGDCDGGQFRTWIGLGGPDDARFLQGAGQSQETYVLDVDGVRLVIDVTFFPDTPPSQRDEIQQILDTIQIR